MTYKQEYSYIYHACFLVLLDNGGLNRDHSQKQFELEFEAFIMGVEEHESWKLSDIDDWFGRLSEEELEVATAGEDTEMNALYESAPEGSLQLLNKWFEDC